MLVSVVVVSWNRREHTLAAVRSAFGQATPPSEIVVVDAASTDGSADAVAREWPAARLIRLPSNKGVAANRNAGIAACRGDVIFFLDDDAELEPRAVAKVIAAFETNPRLGAVGCRVLGGDGRELDRSCWVYPFDPERHAGTPFMTYTFAGGASAVRQLALAQSGGGFSEEFFFAREEEDLALRLLDRGWQIMYLPSAVVRHKGAKAGRTPDGRKLSLDLRHMLWITWRYFPVVAAARLTLYRLAVYWVRAVRKGTPGAWLSGFAGALGRIGPVMATRRPMRRDTYQKYLRLNPLARVVPSRHSAPMCVAAQDG